MKLPAFHMVCVCALLCAPSVPGRTFTNLAGKSMEAEVVGVAGGQAKLKRADGKQFEVAIKSLSEADQTFLNAWQPGPTGNTPAPPPVVDPDLTPGATITLDFPELTVDRHGAPACCHVRLPASYDPAKRCALVVWLGGGDGGNSPATGFVPEGNFVCAGLPFPKGANNPNQENMVGEYEEIWKYQRTMINAILKKIPNIDKGRGVVAGFSNGAHAIDGMLRVRARKEGGMADYFSVFVLADGGGSYSAAKGSYPSMKGKFSYVCWGETSPNAGPSQDVAKDFRSRSPEHVASEIKNTGHAFPESEALKVKTWMEKTVMPVLYK